MKVRAVLFSMSEDIVGQKRRTSGLLRLSSDMLSEGWSDLGGKVPELLSPVDAGSSPEVEQVPMSTSLHGGLMDPDALRGDYREVLRELAMALVQAVLAPAETSQMLERLLVIEEEMASLTGTIALAEQNFDRIRFEYSQQEKRLRYAILDLSMEQAKLRGMSAADPTAHDEIQIQIDDLAFQIGALERRCQEVEQEQAMQIQELDVEVKRYRETRRQLEEEAVGMFQTLHSQVEALRSAARGNQRLSALYQSLDELRGSLDRAVRSA
jgi:chromosome segregation ATPase